MREGEACRIARDGAARRNGEMYLSRATAAAALLMTSLTVARAQTAIDPNRLFQPRGKAGLDPKDLPRLKLK
jgi:hypothetical protein